jgi:bacterioferritin-associated ferredoxin
MLNTRDLRTLVDQLLLNTVAVEAIARELGDAAVDDAAAVADRLRGLKGVIAELTVAVQCAVCEHSATKLLAAQAAEANKPKKRGWPKGKPRKIVSEKLVVASGTPIAQGLITREVPDANKPAANDPVRGVA